ncbi:MAG TPA: hypothetical protein VGH28_03870 [Polyangiaceae bacterium]|jgi:hypothetical protein
MRDLVRAAFAFLLLGCQPSIGDHCFQSTDCSPAGDRLCDTSQPNGYCTIFSCLPNRCPSEAACVATNISVLGCPYDDRHSPSRTSRQLCLKKCQQDSDCRADEGYACIVPADYGILVMDTDQTERVCLPATSYQVSDATPDGVAPVCESAGPDAAPIEAGPGWQGDTDAAADAGADAQDDAGDAASDAPADALTE